MKAIRDEKGRIVLCEWWLKGRTQCRRPAVVEYRATAKYPDFSARGTEAPHRYCSLHGEQWRAAQEVSPEVIAGADAEYEAFG